MPEKTPTDVKQPEGNVSPSPTGGQPAPKPEVPAKPSPEASKPGASSTPDAKGETVVPLPALQEERSRRQALEAEVAQLRQMVTQQAQPQAQPQPQGQPQFNVREELDKLWEDDPRKAVQVEIMTAMDWRDRIDSNLEYQADELARRYPDFNNYRSSALGQVRSLPLNQRGSPNVLETAYFMVRGQNADQIIQQREQELLEKYRRGELNAQGLATPPGSYSSPPPQESLTLSEEQMKVASAMGLTPEQYASQIKVAK
jgi:hypothetical protein